MRWLLTILLPLVLVGTLAFVLVRIAQTPRQLPTPLTSTAPSPTTSPAAAAVAKPNLAAQPTIQSYTDLLHTLPGFAEAAPLPTHLPLNQATRIPLPFPAYLCPRGDLWISHPQAPSLASQLDTLPGNQPTHLCREQVAYICYPRSTRAVRPLPIIRESSGQYTLLRSARATVPLDRRDYHFDSAVLIDNRLVIPCDQGIATLTLPTPGESSTTPAFTQSYHQLTLFPSAIPSIVTTASGFLAYIPATTPDAPASSLLRYANGTFSTHFPNDGFKGPFLQLVPFADGSILQLRPGDNGIIQYALAPLDTAPIDESAVREQVSRLNDEDAAIRDEAEQQLATLGPAAAPLLTRLLTSQPPEAQTRIQQLLGTATHPALGRFLICNDKLRPIWRLSDGGTVYLAEDGVLPLTSATQPPRFPEPAWVVIRPGYPISILPPALARHLAVGAVTLQAWGDDYFVADATDGIRLFFGQELLPIAPTAETTYRRLIGVDRTGRILLARPNPAPKTAPDFLLIDPYLTNPAPTLQVWTISVPEGSIGWDREGWPVVKRSQAWTLKEDHWEVLAGDLFSPKPASPATPAPAGNAAPPQAPFTDAGALPDGTGVLLNATTLRLRRPGGQIIDQPRPESLATPDAAAIVHRDRLYLVHHDGRVARLRISPAHPHPFTIEATFTDNLPVTNHIDRLWVDPAGRLCAIDGTQLLILFPDGKIPPAMLDLIPTAELKQSHADPAARATSPENSQQ